MTRAWRNMNTMIGGASIRNDAADWAPMRATDAGPLVKVIIATDTVFIASLRVYTSGSNVLRQTSIKPRMSSVFHAGATLGITIRQKMVHSLAPSTRAASRNSLGTE